MHVQLWRIYAKNKAHTQKKNPDVTMEETLHNMDTLGKRCLSYALVLKTKCIEEIVCIKMGYPFQTDKEMSKMC
jgi:hypothetical protein